MAGPYYVDLGSPGAWNGRDGTNSASPWLGISGLQKAFDTTAAGETCYVKGTGNKKKFLSVGYDASSGTTLTDGEQVSWDHGEGAWVDGTDTGVVRVATSTAGGTGTVEIELLGTSVAPSDNDVVKGATSTQTITATSSVAVKAIDADTQAGTNAAGPVSFIGTANDASFTVDGTYAEINGDSGGTNIITVTSAATVVLMRNFELYASGGSTKHGISGSSSPAWILINCSIHGMSGAGVTGMSGISFLSTFYGNTGVGNNFQYCYLCSAYDNSSYGIQAAAFGCVLHNNSVGAYGYTAGAPAFVINCVIDANTSKGIEVYATTTLNIGSVILGNRITNHSGAGDIGLDGNNELFWLGWNYFENNADANVQEATLKKLVSTSGADTNIEDGASVTDYGYVDSASHDFSTNYDATDPDTNRRTAITLPWL